MVDLAADGPTGLRLWALLITVSALFGLVIYFGYGGWLYLRHYIQRRGDAARWKIQPKRWVPAKLHRWAISVAAGNMVLGGIVSGTFVYYVMHGGYTALYFDVSDYGWAYTALSTVLLFLAMEAAAYYTHRLLHAKWMFRRFHRWHHRVVTPTPFITVTMHPVEFLMLQGATFLPVFVLPAHAVSFIALLIYVLVFNLMDHSGIHIDHRLPWHGSSRFHDDHHVFFHCNYGQILAVFDRFHGTHRRTHRRYGKEVFGGRGAPVDGAPTDEAYVEY